jgi:hypothetical protein
LQARGGACTISEMGRSWAKKWLPALPVLAAVVALSKSASADDSRKAPVFFLTAHGGVGTELTAGAFAELRLTAGLYGGGGFFLGHSWIGAYGDYDYYSVPIQVSYRIPIKEIFEIRPLAGVRLLFDMKASDRQNYDIIAHDPVAFSGGVRGSFILGKHFVVGLQVDVTPHGATWDQTCVNYDCGISADPNVDTVGKPQDQLEWLVHASALIGFAY